jgi:hypothetical protein
MTQILDLAEGESHLDAGAATADDVLFNVSYGTDLHTASRANTRRPDRTFSFGVLII